jgi:hypothetical protein
MPQIAEIISTYVGGSTLDYTILELFFGARIQPVNHAFTIVATHGNASQTTLQPGAPLGI